MITVNIPHKNATAQFPDGTPPEIIKKALARDFGPEQFDPEGSGYDYQTAKAARIEPNEKGHWPSLDPTTGMVLKGMGHETIDKTLKVEEELGNEIVFRDGRYFSRPKQPQIAARPPAVSGAEPDTVTPPQGPRVTPGAQTLINQDRYGPSYRDPSQQGEGPPDGNLLKEAIRPFQNLAYKTAESINAGLGSFTQHLHDLSVYVGDRFGMKPGGAFEQGAKFYLKNADYWRKKTEEVGSDAVNNLIGEAIGGAVPGIAEFMLNIPYYALLGAAEAHKKGDSEVIGAIREGGERWLIGKVLHQTGVLKQPARAGAMGAVFGAQAAAEGGTPEDIAKALGTGAIYSIGGRGQVGLKDVIRDFRGKGRQPAYSAAEFGKIPAAERPDIVARREQIKLSEPERNALIDESFAGKKATGPELLLTGGPPGAGKSSVLKLAGINKELKKQYVLADADEIKIRAGYEERAEEFHEESSSINKKIADLAIENEYPVIYDSLLSSFVQAKTLIDKQLSKGKDSNVSIAFTNIDAETSMARAKQRVMMGISKREIPHEVSIKGYNRSLPTFIELYKKYKDNPQVDFFLVDNNVDGRDPVDVFRNVDGKEEVFDRNLFDKLMGIDYIPIEGGKKYEREVPFDPSKISESALSERARKAIQLLSETPSPAAQAPAEVQGVQPTQGITTGSDTQVIHTEGRDRVRYEIRDASDIIPSHDPARSFALDPRYPKGVQERPYHKDKAEQIKVIQNAQLFEPDYVLTDNPDAINGPPIITPDGIVLGGNSRAMTTKELYSKFPESADRYRTALAIKAPQFGLDPSAVSATDQPILVRVLLDPPKTPKEMARKARQYNVPPTQGLDVKAEGVSRARMVSDTTMQGIGEALEKHQTLRKYMASQDSKRLITGLLRDGIIEKTQLGRLINKRTGLLTEDGKRLVEQTLRGKIVDDFDLLDALEATPAVLQKLDRILPAMSQLKARGDAWDISEHLKQALDEYAHYKASKSETLDQYLAQGDMFEGAPGENKAVDGLLRALDGDGQVQIAKRFNAFAKAAQRDVKGQKTMFKVESADQAFGRIFLEEEPPAKKTGTYAMKAGKDQGDLFGGMPAEKEAKPKSKEQQILDKAAKLLEGTGKFKYKPSFGSRVKRGREPEKQTGLFGDEKAKKGQQTLFAQDLEPFEIAPVPAIQAERPPVGVSRSKMISAAEKAIGIPIRIGKIRGKGKLGIYKPKEGVIRLKKANDIEAAMHEVGHHAKRLMGLADKMPPEIQSLAYKTAKDVHEEGFAEFFRLFVTQESKAKEAAPGYYDAFNTALAQHRDVQDLIVSTRQAWNQWVALPSVQKVMSVIQPGHTKKKTLPTMNDVYTAVKDALYPLKVVTDQARLEGHEFKPSEDPYLLARVTRGWPRLAEQFLRWGTFQLDKKAGVKFTGPSYMDIIAPIEKAGQRELFDAYLVARRAVADERVSKGFERVLTRGDFEQTVKELEPMFQKSAEKLDAYNSELIDFLKDSGRISAELAERVRAKNPFYAPLYRVMDGEAPVGGLSSKKFSQVVSPIKRLKGSSRDIISPTESILYNTYTVMNAASRNRVGEALIRMSKMEGMGAVIEKVPTPVRPEKLTLLEATRGLRKALDAIGAEKSGEVEAALSDLLGHQKQVRKALQEMKAAEAKEGELDLATIESILEANKLTPDDMFLLDGVITTFRPNYRLGPNEALFYNKGKPQIYELSPELAKAVVNIDASTMNFLTKILSLPAKTLRAGATIFSPEFGIRNPVRDQLVAFIQSKYGYTPGLDLFRGLFHMTKHTELWQLYNTSGAAHANIVSVDRDYLSKNLRELISKSSVKHMVKHPLEIIQRISEFGEEATRVGEFSKAFKRNGGDLNALLEAAIAAKEVTVDFSRLGGPTARTINQICAFWNARLEGLNQMRQTFMERPAEASVKAFLAVTLPSILTWYYQKDDPYYQELPPWRRALCWNFVFHKPDGSLNWVLSIPKPFEYGQIFGTIPEMALEWMNEKDPEAMKDALKQLAKSLEMLPIPSGVLPFGEWWANKSWFFDRPLVSRGKESLDPYLQFGTRTSETVKLVTEVMDKVPGLRQIASPQKIENLINGYFAAAGRLALESSDYLLETFGAVETPPDPAMTLADVPGLRAFGARFPSANSNSIEKFYKMYEKTTTTWESSKQRAGIRGFGLETDKPDNLKQMEQAAKALSTLRKIADITYNAKNIDPEKKRETLDNLYLAMINVARAQLGKKNLR